MPCNPGCELEERVVEVHDILQTPPVLLLEFHLGEGEIFVHLVVQQGPVGIAPAVDALLHVAHYQVLVVVSVALLEQRAEVLPLNVGSVLELVYQEVLVAHSHLFVHEGRVAAGYDILEDDVRFVEHHHVLLFEEFPVGTVEFPGEPEAEAHVAQQPGRAVPGVALSEQKIAENAAVGLLHQGCLALGDHLPGLEALEVGGELFYGIGLADRHILRGCVEFVGEVPDNLLAVRAYGLQVLLAEALLELVGGTCSLHHQAAAHLIETLFDVDALALREVGSHAALHPVQDFRVLPGEGIEDAVHGFADKGVFVQVYLIIGDLPDLPREGLQGLLEEFVDGADREGAVVVENVAQHLPFVLVGRFREKLQDAALHLGRGLVGESYGKDVPVGIFAGEQRYILFREGVCLARPCGGFQNLYHRPQMVLKSQYSQVFVSDVLFHGTSLSRSSSSSRATRSFIRRRNSGLAGTLRGFCTKRSVVW